MQYSQIGAEIDAGSDEKLKVSRSCEHAQYSDCVNYVEYEKFESCAKVGEHGYFAKIGAK